MRPALKLGREAMALKMETLDMARIHRQSMKNLVSAGGASMSAPQRNDRARAFFAETIVPVEKTHSAAVKDDVHVRKVIQSLDQRTRESTASTRNLKHGIARRKAAEKALVKSGSYSAGLLKESGRLQRSMRKQTHQILTSQENERQKTSRQLHDEIAQILISINLRLLTLKKSARASTDDLESEIFATQRLVNQSARTIYRMALKFGARNEK